jgi:hypothetical protein
VSRLLACDERAATFWRFCRRDISANTTDAEQAQFDSIRLGRAQDAELARELETELLQDAEPSPSAATTGATSRASATSGRRRGKRKNTGSSAQSAESDIATTTPHPFASKDAFRVTAASIAVLQRWCPAGVAVSINSTGECQFAAVGVQLQPQRTHWEVRGAVCAFAAAHPDLIVPSRPTTMARIHVRTTLSGRMCPTKRRSGCLMFCCCISQRFDSVSCSSPVTIWHSSIRRLCIGRSSTSTSGLAM